MSSDSPERPGPSLGADGDESNGHDLDAALDLLADRYRRYALYHLRDRSDAVAVDDLVRRVVEWTESEEHGMLVVEFHHKHLPKMDELGVVEYEGETVEYRESGEPVETYLDFAAERERPL